jgi:hypothetical protein
MTRTLAVAGFIAGVTLLGQAVQQPHALPAEVRYVQYNPQALTYTLTPSVPFHAKVCAKVLEGPTACKTVHEFRMWVLGKGK